MHSMSRSLTSHMSHRLTTKLLSLTIPSTNIIVNTHLMLNHSRLRCMTFNRGVSTLLSKFNPITSLQQQKGALNDRYKVTFMVYASKTNN